MSYLDKPSLAGTSVFGAITTIFGSVVTAGLAAQLWLTAVSGFHLDRIPFAFVTAFFFAVPAAACAFLLAGLPVTWLLWRFGVEGPRAYAAAGAATGLLAVLIFPGWQFALIALQGMVVVPILAGLAGGWIWWRAFRRHFQPIGEELA
jgi:hypothetical protein